MQKNRIDLLIIGSGPAGWTAAIYAARAGIVPYVITGLQPGGQLTITTEVENYPGFADGITGPVLMESMQKQALRFGAIEINDRVTKVDFSSSLKILCESGNEFVAKCVIIATGAQAKWLGIPGESELLNYGVSGCATCDGFFFRGQDVAVIGGGNTAAEEALFLAKLAKSVYVIHRRNTMRAEHILVDRLRATPNVSFMWDTEVDSIIGSPKTGVTQLNLIQKNNGKVALQVQGVFIAIGHRPMSDPFLGQISVDDSGYIITDGVKTSVHGVFAAGDVQDKVYRQAVTAAGQGCMAAIEAIHYIDNASKNSTQ